jgi:hypothetical protein
MIDRYIVRAKHEWAFVYLDEEYGTFQCQSSYGTYAHIWGHIGKRTLKEFLAGLDFDYFMKKARPGFCVFDYDKTVERMKQRIIDARRNGSSVDKNKARNAWQALEAIEYTNSQDGFLYQVYHTSDLYDVLGSEFYEYAEKEPDGNSRGFWREIWPELLKQFEPQPALAEA